MAGTRSGWMKTRHALRLAGAEDGVRLFECLNDEEIRRLEASLPFAVEW